MHSSPEYAQRAAVPDSSHLQHLDDVHRSRLRDLPLQSVSVTRSGSTMITEALIGSVQTGESFNFFVQTTEGGAFTQLNVAPITNTCSFPGGSVAGTDLCRWDAPAGTTRIAVAVQAVAGDVLLTSVSTQAPPQFMLPWPHILEHWPSLHTAPAGHLPVQEPQRSGSLETSKSSCASWF